MFRFTTQALSKRTPGYVFWRQGSLTELQHSKRNYLMSERPVPLAHIARRMARVKARYDDTKDFHERNLLRGEYKYFTGKLCDLRAAPFGDMIVVLQCGAFFGFWDAAQVDRILAELFLQLEALSAVELVALFTCMPQLRRQESELYRRVSAALVAVVEDLTVDECVDVCRACTAETPSELLERVLMELTRHLTELTPAQCVEVLDTWSVASEQVRLRTHDGVAALRHHVLERLEELSCVDIAVLYSSLQAGGGADGVPESVQRRLLQAFTRDVTRTCPRSTAMIFTAVHRSHSLSLEVTQRMADRVLFLATDFTPAELLAVFQLYLDNLVSLCVLAADLRAESAAAAAAALLPVSPAQPRISLASGEGMAHSASSAESTVPRAMTPVTTPPTAFSHSHRSAVESEVAAQNVAVLRHVCESLSEQLVTTLESASAYVSVASQMEIVELFTSAVEQLELSAECSGAGEGTASPSSAGAMAFLLRQLPQSRRVLQLVSGKLIANMKHASLAMLIALLEQANSLGNAALQDAVVAAAVQELLTRDISGLSTEAALALEQKLRSLTQLRAEHQRRLATAFIPKVRRYV